MADLDDLFARQASPSSIPLEALIATTPESLDDPVEVTIAAFDPSQRWGPCRWDPKVDSEGGVITPSRGDRALVTRSDAGRWYVLRWEPA